MNKCALLGHKRVESDYMRALEQKKHLANKKGVFSRWSFEKIICIGLASIHTANSSRATGKT